MKSLTSLISFALILGFSFQALAEVSSENLEKRKREEEPFGRAILFSEKGEFIKDFVQFGYPIHWARIKALRSCEGVKKAALNEYCKIDMDF